ncbi:hypothetical protein Taro_036992 [Colocasia esculenta]|uniref:Uncharacterized protein n=1 Tax=Colocasia esculenta TaxID=4460 RepID=A0A843WNC6_COLES|nr:hypothetical protein [Colocasia esculenta]
MVVACEAFTVEKKQSNKRGGLESSNHASMRLVSKKPTVGLEKGLTSRGLALGLSSSMDEPIQEQAQINFWLWRRDQVEGEEARSGIAAVVRLVKRPKRWQRRGSSTVLASPSARLLVKKPDGSVQEQETISPLPSHTLRFQEVRRATRLSSVDEAARMGVEPWF